MAGETNRNTRQNLRARGVRGRARFEMEKGGKTLAVHLDRQGFRRLLDTLERLAASGGRQTFEKSGRMRPRATGCAAKDIVTLDKLVFLIDDSAP